MVIAPKVPLAVSGLWHGILPVGLGRASCPAFFSSAPPPHLTCFRMGNDGPGMLTYVKETSAVPDYIYCTSLLDCGPGIPARAFLSFSLPGPILQYSHAPSPRLARFVYDRRAANVLRCSLWSIPCVSVSPSVLAALVATPALAEDLVFTLVNDSSHTIVEMNVSPVDEELWGENILTVDAVEPGMSGDVTIADGLDVCEYDLRFVTDEGVEASKTQNLCEINTFTVND